MNWYLFEDQRSTVTPTNRLIYYQMKQIIKTALEKYGQKIIYLSHQDPQISELSGNLLLFWSDIEPSRPKSPLPKNLPSLKKTPVYFYLSEFPFPRYFFLWRRLGKHCPQLCFWCYSPDYQRALVEAEIQTPSSYLPLVASPHWVDSTLQFSSPRSVDLFFFGHCKGKTHRRYHIKKLLQKKLPDLTLVYRSFDNAEEQREILQQSKICLIIHQFEEDLCTDWNRISYFIMNHCFFLLEQPTDQSHDPELFQRILTAPIEDFPARCREYLSWSPAQRQQHCQQLKEWFEQHRTVEDYLGPLLPSL